MKIPYVRNIGKKFIPLMFVLSATTGMANISNHQYLKTDNKKDTVEIKYKSEKSNKNEMYILAVLFSVIGGILGAKMTDYIKDSISKNYYDKRFDKESTNVYAYMASLIEKAGIKRPYFADIQDFTKNTSKFTKKYPSRKEYLNMALYALSDNRLTDNQAELMCWYFVRKATDSGEQNSSNLFPFLDNLTDYDDMVKELTSRTSSDSTDTPENRRKSAQAVHDIADEEVTTIELQQADIKNNKVPNDIKFSDIGGQSDAIETLKREILFPIKYPNAFKNNAMNHGFVMYGPSGTGKTLLAIALANESNAHFVKLDANELASKWVGESEENWRNVFEEACEKQPSIIFIDELDAVASKRGSGDNHNDKVLNQILTLLSNVEKNNDQLYVIAATNRLDIIDSAMLRPGRLGTHIEIKAPQSIDDVTDILNIHLKKYNVSQKLNKKELAAKMLNMKYTGADIAFVVHSAWKNAMERSSVYAMMDNNTYNDNEDEIANVKITNNDMNEAIEKYNKNSNQSRKIGYKL